MSGRRLSLSHVLAEDRGPESGAPILSRTRGQMVHGYATFYIPKATGWFNLGPGRLELAEIHGGASGLGNHDIVVSSSRLAVPQVEFYLYADGARPRNFVALNRAYGEVFTFAFFGRRFS